MIRRINWLPESAGGGSLWSLKMVFDEGIRGICSGESRIYDENDSLLRINLFGSELRYRRVVNTLFGSTFVQHGGLGIASYHFNSLKNTYINYSRAPTTWL